MSTVMVTRFEWNLTYDELLADNRSNKCRKSDPFQLDGVKYQLKLRPSQPDEEINYFTLYFCVKDYGNKNAAEVEARIWIEDDKNRMINLSKSNYLNSLFCKISDPFQRNNSISTSQDLNGANINLL